MQDGSKDSIGVFLRKERMKRNIGLQDISEATGISLGVLEALEAENREKLPAEIYIKAFYRKYADFLDLSVDEVMGSSREQENTKQAKQDDRFHFQTIVELKSPGEGSYDDSIRLLLVAVLVVCFGLLIYWAYKTDFNPMQFIGDLFGSLDAQDFRQPTVG